MEINLDPDTSDELELIIAKFDFDKINEWSSGFTPHFNLFYNPLHENGAFETIEYEEYDEVLPLKGQEQIISNQFKSFKRIVERSILL